MQKLRSSIVLMMITIAIILAIGVFLAINAVQNRNSEPQLEIPDTAVDNFLVTVGTEQIALQIDPNLRPTIIDMQVVDDTPRVEDTPAEQPAAEPTTIPEATAVPPAAEAATAVPVVVSTEKIIFIDYVVQQGDTLYSISQRIDTSIALMAEKGLSQDSLVPGQVIRLPIGNAEYCAGRGRPYAIGEGDTVFNISQRYNTTPENLQAINGLDANYAIRIADIICVP